MSKKQDFDFESKPVKKNGGKIRIKKRIFGDIAEGIKKIIPEKVASQVAGKALGFGASALGSMVGVPPSVAQAMGETAGKSLVSGAYDADFQEKDGLAQFGKATGKDLARNAVKNAIQSQMPMSSGSGLGGQYPLDVIVMEHGYGFRKGMGNPLLKDCLSSEPQKGYINTKKGLKRHKSLLVPDGVSIKNAGSMLPAGYKKQGGSMLPAGR